MGPVLRFGKNRSFTSRGILESALSGRVLGTALLRITTELSRNMKITLPRFSEVSAMGWSSHAKKLALKSPTVRSVVSFALGPKGTNIEQAAQRWHDEMELDGKAKIVLCDLPETAVEMAISLRKRGTLGIFWTCAVFKREHQVFFNNPNTFPFFFQHEMRLDEMQLAVSSKKVRQAISRGRVKSVRIATHVSPAPLIECLREAGAVLVDASSNSEAARMCAAGDVAACVTTESGRKIHGLVKAHSFGSPEMVFFGGITPRGIRLLEETNKDNDWPTLSGFVA